MPMSQVTNTFELESTYVQLHDGPAAVRVPVDADFWQRIEERKELHRGRLLMVTHQSGAMSHWEIHPAGDEVLYLLSGKMDVVLEIDNSEQVVSMVARTTIIVPQGIWHTVKVHEPGDLLSITRGAGTRVRPLS
jgi:quercetin dioxygenase-like cupin family protein